VIALDLETTGFSPFAGHGVIEVATVIIEDGTLGPAWSSLVGPRRPVAPDATRVHGITEIMLEGAPEPAAVAATLRESCADHTLAFHNAEFDVPFVQSLLREAGLPPLYNPVLDVLGIARGLFGSGGNSLGELTARLGLPRELHHRALGDALTTARVLLALLPRWEKERPARSLAELAAATQDAVRLSAHRAAFIRRGFLLASAWPGTERRPARGASGVPGGSPAAAPDGPGVPPEGRLIMQATAALEVGKQAPDFTLKGPGGQPVGLAEYRGSKNVLLAFFPLAFSPVCSHQLPELQERLAEFAELDTVVLGISVDSHYSNQAFARQLGIEFPLLSDFKHEASQAYGVFLPEKRYSGRALFLIDREGRLIYRDLSPDLNQIPSPEKVLAALRAPR
jgi:DNA polymerase III epsilon subunit family exonuclease